MASTYEIGGSNKGDHKPITVNGTISNYLYLRPIPQGQIDSMIMTEGRKTAYQNPGY